MAGVHAVDLRVVGGEVEFRALGYVQSENDWRVVDSTGTVYKLQGGSSSGAPEEAGGETKSGLRCLAISPLGDQCAIAVDETVSMHEYPGFAETNNVLVRNTLPINHLEFGNDGEHV